LTHPSLSRSKTALTGFIKATHRSSQARSDIGKALFPSGFFLSSISRSLILAFGSPGHPRQITWCNRHPLI